MPDILAARYQQTRAKEIFPINCYHELSFITSKKTIYSFQNSQNEGCIRAGLRDVKWPHLETLTNNKMTYPVGTSCCVPIKLRFWHMMTCIKYTRFCFTTIILNQLQENKNNSLYVKNFYLYLIIETYSPDKNLFSGLPPNF